MMGVRTVVLDSNAVNPIVELPGAFEVVERAVSDGHVEILGTHILEDELAATRDLRIRANLQRILLLTIDRPTPAVVLGVSRLGRAVVGDDQDFEAIDRLRSGRTDGTHTNDALYALTAKRYGADLVTAEKKRFRNRALAEGINVATPEEFLTSLGYTMPTV